MRAARLAAVEIYKVEAGGLEQAPRHLVLLTGDGHVHEFGALGFPLRAPATGIRARHPALGHSHDRALLYRGTEMRAARRPSVGNFPSGERVSCVASKTRDCLDAIPPVAANLPVGWLGDEGRLRGLLSWPGSWPGPHRQLLWLLRRPAGGG